MTDTKKIIDRYFSDGKLIQYPSKRHKQLIVLDKISSYFLPGIEYDESEVNEKLKYISNCRDHITLRRDLIDAQYLQRTKDGKKYWLNSDMLSNKPS